MSPDVKFQRTAFVVSVSNIFITFVVTVCQLLLSPLCITLTFIFICNALFVILEILSKVRNFVS
jgi:hypothetical protein